MAVRQAEIIRQLNDGFAVAWDTTEVSDETRDEFQETVEGHIDCLVQVLNDDGETASVIAVETKAPEKSGDGPHQRHS